MKEKSQFEKKLIGNFMFCDEDYIIRNFKESNLSKFQGFSRETIMQSTIIDEELIDVNVFYLLVEDYIYNILIPSRDGHKLLLKLSNDSKNLLEVYSLNYQDVMNEENVFKRLRKK